MGRRTQHVQLRAKRTRRQLLGGAKRIFAQKGYDGASVDDICDAARCSKGAYYFHFVSKEEAFHALLDAWIEERANGGSRTEGWPPALIVEFWAQASRKRSIASKLTVAIEAWRAARANVELELALEVGASAQAAIGLPAPASRTARAATG